MNRYITPIFIIMYPRKLYDSLFLFQVHDNYNSMEDGMSQSVPSYRQGSTQCRSRKESVRSLHPSRDKGQKSSYQRLSHLTSDMRKNKSR